MTNLVKILATLTIFTASCLGFVMPAKAVTSPLAVPNNRFGIHILEQKDINDAASLVNSNGGDWGYVTLVIQDNDRDKDKWQNIFDELREKHLIPIVRLATHGVGETWVKPVVGEAPAWASFLDSLNWVIQNRYVVIFNEPNHAYEWGGSLSPLEYAGVLYAYSKALKEQNPDFFILNAGFDASAPNGSHTMDEQQYLAGMLAHNPQVFDYLDGWSSHSYPNPGFSSPPDKNGRGSIKSYEWEEKVLKNLGIEKKLPVFITETGWSRDNLGENTIADYYEKAFNTAWNSNDIVAVTPFVFDFQSAPFANFSWKKADGFAAQFATVQNLAKVPGNPKRVEGISLVGALEEELIANTTYFLLLKIRNSGQTIWSEAQGYRFTTESAGIQTSILPNLISHIKPGQEINLAATVKTPTDPGTYTLKINMVRADTVLGNPIVKTITVRAPVAEVKGTQTELQVEPQPTREPWKILLYPTKLLAFLKNLFGQFDIH